MNEKLDLIADIWNNYIWDYQFCKSKIKFTKEAESNYFGDIRHYFEDTFEVIYSEEDYENNFSNNFEKTISFLQAIYVQQDFVEELLLLFQCKITKGDLKTDQNYSVNREIRNELIGHPIRRNNGSLTSSTIFSNALSHDKICYLRYHKQTNYCLEHVTYYKRDIVTRHKLFLDKYFDIILQKLFKILREFKKKIEKIESLIEKIELHDLLKILEHSFESIFEHDYLYCPEKLLRLYNDRHNHDRYNCVVKQFYNDLSEHLSGTKLNIDEILLSKKKLEVQEGSVNQWIDLSNIEFVDGGTTHNSKTYLKGSSSRYAMRKLFNKRNEEDFEDFSSIIRGEFVNNKLIMKELYHMKENLYDDIEYYSSHLMVSKILETECD